MSDAVLAAIIAATATLCASFMQLRVALAKEADARSRGQPISRRRSQLPMILVGIMLLASAVGGFALSQWLGSAQRTAQADLQRDLRDRIAELDSAVGALQRLSSATAGVAGIRAAAQDAASNSPASSPGPIDPAPVPAAAPAAAGAATPDPGIAPTAPPAPLPDAHTVAARSPGPTPAP